MAFPQLKGYQIADQTVSRDDLNTKTSGKAVITRILNQSDSGVKIYSSTGQDSGTGDVRLMVDTDYLDGIYLRSESDPYVSGFDNIVSSSGTLEITRTRGSTLTTSLLSIRGADARNSSDVPGSDGSESYLPNPNDSYLDKGLHLHFQTGWGGSSWGSTLIAKGWTGEYAAWSLSGGAGTSTANDWYLRSGVGASWNTPVRIWHSGDFSKNDFIQTKIGVGSGNLGGDGFDASTGDNKTFLSYSKADASFPTPSNGGMFLNISGNSTSNPVTLQLFQSWYDGGDALYYRTLYTGGGTWFRAASRSWVNSQIPNVNNPAITIATSGAASGGGTFHINQPADETITISATDTTYPAGTASLINAGTNTSNRVWSAKILADYVTNQAGPVPTLQSVTDQGDTSTHIITAQSFKESSLRSLKKNIRDFRENATELLSSVQIKKFNYKTDIHNTLHIGIIADDEHEYFSGKDHDAFDLPSTISILIKGFQELEKRISVLENGGVR